MPNWVFNTLTIQGPKDQVDSIKERLNRPFDVLHDTWNKDTNTMEVSTSHYSAPVFSFWNICNPLEEGIPAEQYVKQPQRSDLGVNDPNWWADTMRVASKDNSWYAWNNRNWGCKWDVAASDDDKYPNTELIEYKSEDEDHWVIYKFETAWAPPMPAMEKLSLLVPNCVITLEYEEEQGWGGEVEFVNGEETSHSQYDEKCWECDAIDNMDYCEECDSNVCLSCKSNRENDKCEHEKAEEE